jgi:asparagine synthase (glutamine-hydrolysing)
MFNEDRSMSIVFNGEIYNFEELRDDLEKRGHSFRTQSDTETILHAYEEWGEESPARLRGMFAFAIWDGRRRQVFLARDRVGKKPVYYLNTPEYFIFGSELKALLAFPNVNTRIDLEALSDYLSFQYIPSPKCIFKEFRKLPPAHTLTVSSNGLRLRRYWDLRFREITSKPLKQWTDELSGGIVDAVRCRLKSEVPLGAFLSGGLDSSIVVGTMAGLMTRPVETMSIGFTEDAYNELPYAREVSDRYHTRHHEFVVSALDEDILGKMAWMFDEPFADSSAIPTYHVSRIARKQVTVALSGDGGDENFAGYRRYYFDLLENRVRGIIPEAVRRIVFGGLAGLYPKGDWLPQPLRAKSMLRNLSLTPERGYFRTRSVFQPEMKRKLLAEDIRRELDGYDSFSVLEKHFNDSRGWNPLSRIQYVDIMTYLPDDILVKVDRASMANSLEVRSPLLDNVLMELVASIPHNLKMNGAENKHILKKMSDPLLPKSIIYREKMGFSVPMKEWVKNKSVSKLIETLLGPGANVREYMDGKFIFHLLKSHRRGTANFENHLWTLMVFEMWHRRYVK